MYCGAGVVVSLLALMQLVNQRREVVSRFKAYIMKLILVYSGHPLLTTHII